MTVSLRNTPLLVEVEGSNTPSVVSVYGSGTPPTPVLYDLLLAVVTVYASTTVALPATPAGWALSAVSIEESSYCYLAYYTRTASGTSADSAPTWAATLSGTATHSDMSVTLYDFYDSGGNTPLFSVYGTATGTTGTISPVTTGNVPSAGCYGVGALCYASASAAVSITTPTSGGTWVLGGITETGSHYGHGGNYYLANPTSGSTLTCTLAHGTSTYQAAAVAVIGVPPALETSPGLEVYGFAIPSPPLSNATINSVTVAVTEHQSNAAQQSCLIALWDGTSAQIGTTQTGTASTSTSNVSTATWTGVTYSQLATLRVRVYGNAAAGSGYTESVDGVSVVVNYTPSPNATVAMGSALAVTSSIPAPSLPPPGGATANPAVLAVTSARPAPAVNVFTSPYLEIAGFGSFTGINSSATINTVTVAVTEYQSVSTMGAGTFELWDYSGTPVKIGMTQTGTASTSSSNVDTAVYSGVSYAQLATLRVRVYGNSGNTPSGTAYVDGAGITVNYTPSPNATVTMGSALAVSTSTPAPVVRQDRTVALGSPVGAAAGIVTPAVTTSLNATVTLGSALAVAVAQPAPAVSGSLALSGPVTVAAAITAPTVTAGSNATVVLGSALAVTSTQPAPVVRQDQNAVPATLAVTSAKPAPGVSGGLTATTLAVAAGIVTPTVTASGNALVTMASALAVSTAAPLPAVRQDQAVSALVTTVTAAQPPPASISGGLTASVLSASTASPAPALSGSLTAAVLAVTSSQPAVTVTTTGNANVVLGGPLALTTSVPVPAVRQDQTVTLSSPLAVSTAAPFSAAGSSASVTLIADDVIAASAWLPAPAVTGNAAIVVMGSALAVTAAQPAAAITTGGVTITLAGPVAVTTAQPAPVVTVPARPATVTVTAAQPAPGLSGSLAAAALTATVSVPAPSVGFTAYSLHSQGSYGLVSSGNTTAYSFGVQFSVSTAATLTGIWWYSGPAATALPAACALYNANTQAQITGTLNSSPSWSGAAGSGWVKCAYSGPALSTGISYVAVVRTGGTVDYYQLNAYWTSGGGAAGITNGPLTAPSSAASVNGQMTYLAGGSIAFPTSTATGYDFGVDVEVTAAGGGGSATVVMSSALAAAGAVFLPGVSGSLTASAVTAAAAVPAPVVSAAGGATITPGTLAVITAVSAVVVARSYRLMDGQSGRPGVGSSGTQPPGAVTGLTGPYVVGTCFKVTSACWLEGYWWWVTPTVQETAAQKFTLWSANIDGSAGRRGSVIAAGTVTSGTLTAGAFNWVPLATPVPLAIGWTYVATTGWSPAAGIPYTSAQFGSGNPYSAGITNGPLAGFSGQGGSNPDPFLNFQCAYARVTADPAVSFPSTNSSDFNGWIDVQVTNTAPAGSTYRLFPSVEGYQQGTPPDYNTANDPDGYTIGNTFALSQPCRLLKLWFLSASGVTALPTRCAIWDVATQAEIAGTDVISPSWLTESGGAGSPGSGWVYCDYSGAGITLPAGRNMIAAAFYPTSGGNTWRGYSIPFWGTGGVSGGPAINLGASGLDYGVISAPSTASGVPLQGGYNGPTNTWGYPGTWNNPENDWTDVEVIPAATGPVTPGVVTAAAAVPVPVVRQDALASPAAVAGTSAVVTPAVTTTGSALVTPATLAASASEPAPAVSGSAMASPAGAAVTASLPAVTVTTTGSALVTPAAVTAASAIATPPVTTGSGTSVTPAALAVSTSAPAPVVRQDITAAPAALSVTSAQPAVTVTAVSNAAAAPSALAAITSVPLPAVTAGGSATASPATLSAAVTVPAPAAATGTLVTVTVLAVTTSVPGVSASGGAAASPVLLAVPVTVPAASVSTAGNANVAAVTVTVVFTAPQPAVRQDRAVTAVTVSVTATFPAAEAAGISGITGTVAWTARPCAPRWQARPAPTRWRAVMTSFTPVAAVSLAFINITWTSELLGTVIDPTGQSGGSTLLPVQMAFPVSSGNPLAPAQASIWFTASWLLGSTAAGWTCQCLVGPVVEGGLVQLTAGMEYDAWSKVSGTPESPVQFAGTIEVY